MPTKLPPTTRTGTSMSGTVLFLIEELAVIAIVLAHELVDLIQVGPQREGARNRKGPNEDVGILQCRLILQGVVVGPAKALHHVQSLAVLESADLGLVVEADGIHHQGVAFPLAYRIAHPGGIGIDRMYGAISRNNAEDARIFVQDDHVIAILDDLRLIR